MSLYDVLGVELTAEVAVARVGALAGWAAPRQDCSPTDAGRHLPYP